MADPLVTARVRGPDRAICRRRLHRETRGVARLADLPRRARIRCSRTGAVFPPLPCCAGHL